MPQMTQLAHQLWINRQDRLEQHGSAAPSAPKSRRAVTTPKWLGSEAANILVTTVLDICRFLQPGLSTVDGEMATCDDESDKFMFSCTCLREKRSIVRYAGVHWEYGSPSRWFHHGVCKDENTKSYWFLVLDLEYIYEGGCVRYNTNFDGTTAYYADSKEYADLIGRCQRNNVHVHWVPPNQHKHAMVERAAAEVAVTLSSIMTVAPANYKSAAVVPPLTDSSHS